MGVPAFYRWLVNKYPLVVTRAFEDRAASDTTEQNPNGMEFDNLYLDMNAIIHPCFHPDDHSSTPTTFEDVFNNVFAYIDRLFSIVRPRKLLYMAIDGVAPRAKMNQQRSRRFQAAKQNEISEAEEDRLRRQFALEGKPVLPKQESEVSDSNFITPGTDFMHKLSKALQGYISSRISCDKNWKDLKVILSDANLPGEGEHKIMSFIRKNRSLPGYDPNTRHCLYGLDADLIMLAVATHEIHFSILRESVHVDDSHVPRKEKSLSLENSINADHRCPSPPLKPYEFLQIWILREYLEMDLQIEDPPENIQIDFERIVDDFVFMCFFSGNDFLPHLPTLEIHEGAIDLLITVYKKNFKSLGGYLVDMSKVEEKKAAFVKLSRVEKFILLVGEYEGDIFKKRSEKRERLLRRLQRECEDERDEETEDFDSAHETGECDDVPTASSHNLVARDACSESFSFSTENILENTRELKDKLKGNLRKRSDILKNCGFGSEKIKLGTPGCKERYYKVKFCIEGSAEIECKRKDLVYKYTEGLVWTLRYYYSGVPSWTWFYPFHYGPFASDFKGLSHVQLRFVKGVPLKPFTQLLAVLPSRSAHALPQAYAELMIDDKSNIIDFYPDDFRMDLDGKRYLWQGICHLPFIDEKRLLSESNRVEKELSVEEIERNTVHHDRLFVSSTNILASRLPSIQNEYICLNAISEGIGGVISFCCKHIDRNLQEVKDEENGVLDICYMLPDSDPHIPRLLPHVTIPEKKIFEGDILETKLWHEDSTAGQYSSNVWNQRAQIMERGAPRSRAWFPDQTHLIPKPIASGAGTVRTGWFRDQAPKVLCKGSGRGCFDVGRGSTPNTAIQNAWNGSHGPGVTGIVGNPKSSGIRSHGHSKPVDTGNVQMTCYAAHNVFDRNHTSMGAKPYRRGQFGNYGASSSSSNQFDRQNQSWRQGGTHFVVGRGRAHLPQSFGSNARDSWRPVSRHTEQ